MPDRQTFFGTGMTAYPDIDLDELVAIDEEEGGERVTMNNVTDLASELQALDQALPNFLSRPTLIIKEQEEIAAEAMAKRDAPDGPKKNIGKLMGRLNTVRGKAKGKKKAPQTITFVIPTDSAEKKALEELLKKKIDEEKTEMKELTAIIKPAQKRSKNLANFQKMLDEKHAAAEKAKKIQEMQLIKKAKEEADKEAEAKKGDLIIESKQAWENCSTKVKDIMAILENVIHRLLYGDEFDTIGRGALAKRIQETVDADEELLLYMLAFPFKSCSTAKSLWILPDLAEEAALQTIGRLLTDLNAIYKPGARYVMISDGCVFSDVYGVRDDAMLAYTLGVQELCHKIHPKMECRSMYDVFPVQVCEGYSEDGGPLQFYGEKEIRDEIFDVYQPDLEWVDMQREIDSEFKGKGSDFQKFLYEDADPSAFPNNTQRNNSAKKRAMQMLQRDEALRIFTMGALPNAIRVSIRPRSQTGPTYCINMIGMTQREMGKQLKEAVDLTTPWHNVLVRICEDKDAERDRLELLDSDKNFYIRRQFIPAFEDARPLMKDGKVQGFSVPRESLQGDPTADFKPADGDTVHKLPPLPTEEEAQANRRKVIENAVRFGWSQEVTDSLKRNGDKILNAEVTRDMLAFGANM